jgi:MOSC domain-containing protein YiiM
MVELVKEPTETSLKILNQHTHGTVVSLQLCVKHKQPMKQVTSVRAIENRGLEGDRHAMPNSSRQVLLLEQETCVEYDFPIGAIRENITTRGIDLMALPKKTRLQIGDAILETTKECEPCSMVDDVRMGLRQELDHKRGMLARVVRGGEIQIGSKITILEP